MMLYNLLCKCQRFHFTSCTMMLIKWGIWMSWTIPLSHSHVINCASLTSFWDCVTNFSVSRWMWNKKSYKNSLILKREEENCVFSLWLIPRNSINAHREPEIRSQHPRFTSNGNAVVISHTQKTAIQHKHIILVQWMDVPYHIPHVCIVYAY